MKCILSLLLSLLVVHPASAADRSLRDNPDLAQYFEDEVANIERQNSLLHYDSVEAWERDKPKLRAELFEMLGLKSEPERTPLNVQVTGTVEETEFVVEKLHFQSMPGLYVTANFYRPKNIDQPLPTVLYVCGHARVKDGNISFGNKTAYQHHGAWFARNGYTCLTIDTIQLGEIEGVHHGTYSHNRWWWNARGYTPAGVEAWNCIRALDYLQTRPEVDAKRIGVTGRSGGGAYSWWIAALDDRIQCAVPVAGITSLRNHVVDGCVEGHCDCMFMVNTHRWDYAKVAALVAPRPLLISNSDKDSIFPLDGVVAVHRQVRHIYDLYQKPRQLGLHITEGPHKDTQELRIHAFRWMNRWLKHDESLIESTATKMFEPPQLKVFDTLPADERVTSIDEDFVPHARATDQQRLEFILNNQAAWAKQSLKALRTHSFAAWPDDSHLDSVSVAERIKLRVSDELLSDEQTVSAVRLRFESQQHVPLSVDLLFPVENAAPDNAKGADFKQSGCQSLQLLIVDSDQWNDYQKSCLPDTKPTVSDQREPSSDMRDSIDRKLKAGHAVAIFAPRGIGPHAWIGDKKKQTQIRRRFQLIGTTADAMRVWDIRAVISLLQRQSPDLNQIELAGMGKSGWLALTALVFSDHHKTGNFSNLQTSRDNFPIYLNFARSLHAEDLTALALRNSAIQMKEGEDSLVRFVEKVANDQRWRGQAFSGD